MLPSGLPEFVADNEDLARFLTQSNHFNRDHVRPTAFLPSKKDDTTSVFRHEAQPVGTLKQLGLNAAGNRNLYGAAILKAGEVRKARLEVRSSEPPARHAKICNWPQHQDPDLERAQKKERALLLASAAGAPVLFA